MATDLKSARTANGLTADGDFLDLQNKLKNKGYLGSNYNKLDSYTGYSYGIVISANPTNIAAGGGQGTLSTRYTDPSAGAGTPSPTYYKRSGAASLSGATYSYGSNPGSARRSIFYSTAESKTSNDVTVTQSAGGYSSTYNYNVSKTSFSCFGGYGTYSVYGYWNGSSSATDITKEPTLYSYNITKNTNNYNYIEPSTGTFRVYGTTSNTAKTETITLKGNNASNSSTFNITVAKNDCTASIEYKNTIGYNDIQHTGSYYTTVEMHTRVDPSVYPVVYLDSLLSGAQHSDNSQWRNGSLLINYTFDTIVSHIDENSGYETSVGLTAYGIRPAYCSTISSVLDCTNKIYLINPPVKANFRNGWTSNGISNYSIPVTYKVEILTYKNGALDSCITGQSSRGYKHSIESVNPYSFNGIVTGATEPIYLQNNNSTSYNYVVPINVTGGPIKADCTSIYIAIHVEFGSGGTDSSDSSDSSWDSSWDSSDSSW